MSNVSAVMLGENLAMKDRQAFLPKNEDEVFPEMLAVLLGISSFTTEELPKFALTTEQELLDESKVGEKGNLFRWLKMQNPRLLSGEQLQEGEKLPLLKEKISRFAQIKQNITAIDFMELTNAEKILQEQALPLKELAVWQDRQDKISERERQELQKSQELQDLQKTQELQSLRTFQVMPSTAVTREELIILGESETEKEVQPSEQANLFHHQDFRKIEGQRLRITLPESEETKEAQEKMIKSNNAVINQGENLSSVFTTDFSKNAENTAEELRLNVEHFSRDLPEIVIPKLKTFENSDGSKDVIIHLEPKDLGKLIVKLTAEEGTVSVKFVAHYPVTRDLLESGLNSLRQSFIEQGISFDRLDVELGGQQLAQNHDQPQQQLNWSQERKDGEKIGWQENSYFENTTLEGEPDSIFKRGACDYLI